jgi:hypothetical protein
MNRASTCKGIKVPKVQAGTITATIWARKIIIRKVGTGSINDNGRGCVHLGGSSSTRCIRKAVRAERIVPNDRRTRTIQLSSIAAVEKEDE